jgi:hypothetical protein
MILVKVGGKEYDIKILYLLLKMGNGINGDKIDKYLIIKSIRDYYFSDERGLKKVQKFIEGDEGNIRIFAVFLRKLKELAIEEIL